MVDTVRTEAQFLSLLSGNNAYADPRATVLQSQLARDLIVSLATLVGNVGVITNGTGTTYPLTAAGLQAAHDDLPSAGGKISIPAGTVVWSNSPVRITKSNVEIVGSGAGTVLQNAANATSTDLIFVGSNPTVNLPSLTVSSLLNASPAIGQNVIVLVAGGVAALGLVQYDYIVITDPSGNTLSQVAQVVAISGETLTLSESLCEVFTTGNATTVRKISGPVSDVKIHNLALDGNGNTGGTSLGIALAGAVRCEVSDIWASRMPQSAVYSDTTYDLTVRNIHTERCGSDQVAVVESFRASVITLDTIKAINGPAAGATGGFGIGCNFINTFTITNCHTSYTLGRGLKVYISSVGTIANCRADTAYSAAITAMLVVGHDINIVGCSTSNSPVGIQISGDRIRMSGGNNRNNTLDVWVSSGDSCHVEGAYTTFTDQGTKTSWVGPWKSFSPTVTQSGAVSTFSANVCFYIRTGNTVHFSIHMVVNNAGAAAGANDITVTLPVTPKSVGISFQIGAGQVYDSSAVSIYRGLGVAISGSVVSLAPTNSGTYGYLGSVDFTAALATGDVIDLAGTYEVA